MAAVNASRVPEPDALLSEFSANGCGARMLRRGRFLLKTHNLSLPSCTAPTYHTGLEP